MSEKIKTTTANLSAIGQRCPRCGNEYTAVEYYTGEVVSSSNTRLNYNTVQTQTLYKNVTGHVGGLCRFCDKERQKKTAKVWAVVTAVGLVMCVIGMLMKLGAIEYDTFKYGGLEVLLITFGGLALLIGVLVVISTAVVNPTSKLNYVTLYARFISRLKSDKNMQPGLAYLSADAAKKLQWRK
ncbi:MAG: hypothetical protein Q4C01_03315 [Clostridia bacterium]|nr:hypothetical protein [Clostridia bacterium]